MRKVALRVSLLAFTFASSALAQRDTVFSWSKTLPAGARFAIRNLNGFIDVRPGTTDRIEVRATMRTDTQAAGDVTFDVREKSPDDITICTLDRGATVCDPGETYGNDNHPSVRYTVEIPKGLRVQFQTLSGNVIIMQSAAEVSASTGNGDVVVRESMSGVSAKTSNGDVTVAAANGPVVASSGNGNVLVAAYGGPVNATSGNGDVDVRMITLGPTTQPSMTVSSGNGSVNLTLPADFNGEIDATTGDGKIKSEFPVSASIRQDSRLRGKIGNGNGLLIKLHSGNGRLEIRKG
jgi:DUF4097 and DUF4098 domain-containing protein YvlB